MAWRDKLEVVVLIAIASCSKGTCSDKATTIEMHQSWNSLGGRSSLDATVQRDGCVGLVTDEGDHLDATIDPKLVDAFIGSLSKTTRGGDCSTIAAVEGTSNTSYTIFYGERRTTLSAKTGECWKMDGTNLRNTDDLVDAEYELVHEISQLQPPEGPTALRRPGPTQPIDWTRLPSATEIEIKETFSSTLRYQTITTKLQRTNDTITVDVTTWRPTIPETKVSKTIPPSLVDEFLRAVSRSTIGACSPQPWSERGAFLATYMISVPNDAPVEIVRRSRLCWKGNGSTLAVDGSLGPSVDALMTKLHEP